MRGYILRRVLFFFPTIILISMVTFGLSKLVPGDPVLIKLGDTFGEDIRTRRNDYSKYKLAHQELGLNMPAFYFSLLPKSYPDTIHQIIPLSEKKICKKLIHNVGNWPQIQHYRQNLVPLLDLLDSRETDLPTHQKSLIRALNQATTYEAIASATAQLDRQKETNPSISQKIQAFKLASDELKQEKKISNYLPKFVWHGAHNQYHHWLVNFLIGDFGNSLYDGRSIGDKIRDSLPNTLWINAIAYLLSLFLGIVIGVYLGGYTKTKWSRFTHTMLYIGLSIPSFWLATMLIIFFSTNDYGSWTNLFPAGGVGRVVDGDSFFRILYIKGSHFFLPILCLTIPTAGFIALQMRRSIKNEWPKDYIKTALMKGLSKTSVLWKHAFPNGLFPIITLLGGLLPGLISGSVAIELIFNIPGMGRLLLHSIVNRDWPAVFSILMISSVLIVIGILIVDLLYYLLDPRIRYSTKPKKV